jgi:hypothetical protein
MDFKLVRVSFISDKVNNLHQFKEYKRKGSIYSQLDTIDNSQDKIIKDIPMMLRRRLTPSTKYSVGLAIDMLNHCALNEQVVDKIIFSSFSGEASRCVNLLSEMVLDNGLSPMEFSASVHNSSVGVCSISKKFHGETTAISAEQGSLAAALVEAYASLYGQGLKRVLVVAYEGIVDNPKMMIPNVEQFYGNHAFSMLLEKVDGECKCLSINSIENNSLLSFDVEKCSKFNSVEFLSWI